MTEWILKVVRFVLLSIFIAGGIIGFVMHDWLY